MGVCEDESTVLIQFNHLIAFVAGAVCGGMSERMVHLRQQDGGRCPRLSRYFIAVTSAPIRERAVLR